MQDEDILKILLEKKEELYRMGVQSLSFVRAIDEDEVLKLLITSRSESNMDYIDIENIQEKIANILNMQIYATVKNKDNSRGCVNVF